MEDDPEFVVVRRSTTGRLSREVFISYFQIVDYYEQGGHVFYLIRVCGRTKFLANEDLLRRHGLLVPGAGFRASVLQ